MKHGGWPSFDWPNGVQYLCLAVNGAGAAAPVAPAGLTAVQPDFPVKANVLSRVAAEIPTRSGVGAYTVTIDPTFALAQLLDCPCNVYGAAGAWASVQGMVASTRVITVKVFTAAGAAYDLLATDLLVIDIKGRDSLA